MYLKIFYIFILIYILLILNRFQLYFFMYIFKIEYFLLVFFFILLALKKILFDKIETHWLEHSHLIL